MAGDGRSAATPAVVSNPIYSGRASADADKAIAFGARCPGFGGSAASRSDRELQAGVPAGCAASLPQVACGSNGTRSSMSRMKRASGPFSWSRRQTNSTG